RAGLVGEGGAVFRRGPLEGEDAGVVLGARAGGRGGQDDGRALLDGARGAVDDGRRRHAARWGSEGSSSGAAVAVVSRDDDHLAWFLLPSRIRPAASAGGRAGG